MPGIQFITTKAGRAALVNAEHNGTTPVTVLEIGLTAAVFTASEDMVTLPGEIKRLKSISGAVVAPDTIHVTIRDDSNDIYTVRGIGYWLSNGVLLGVYSQPDPIMEKSAQAMVLLAADVIFTTLKATSLTFGDATFTNPPATTDRQGVVELATGDETAAGTDAVRAVTPAGLVPALAKSIAGHVAVLDPHIQYLTPNRANALYFRKLPDYDNSATDCDTLLDMGVRQVSVANDKGITPATHLPAGGNGYGTLVVVNSGAFVRQTYTEDGPNPRTWERTGYLNRPQPFSDRTWKLLWDSVSFDPASKQDKLGFVPVQQGTGVGQLTNSVKIGWSGNALKATVDATDQGNFVFQSALDAAVAKYLPLVGGTVTGLLTANGATGAVSASGANSKPALEAVANGPNDEAYIRFHRPTFYAVHLGLDVNNNLSVGGYSMGNAAYKLWHAGNFSPASKQDTLGYKPPQAVGGRLNSVIVDDSRATSYAPKDRDMGIYFDFTNNDADGLGDGGVQHGVITFRQWGAAVDFSGGPAHQLGFTANGNLYHRIGSTDTWGGWQRLLTSGQSGTLPDGGMPIIKDCNTAPLGWSTYTQEATVNRPSGYGQLFTSSLSGTAAAGNGNWLLQRALTTDNQTLTRVNIGNSGWSAWIQAWTSGNFDPSSKATGVGYSMQWSGKDGQPTWLIGGEAPGAIYVYNPSNFSVRYAGSAGTSTNAENISNGNSYMRLAWSDPGGQPTYLWGSDGPTAARLAVIANLSVGNARTVGSVPMRFQENPQSSQPYYLYGVEAGRTEMTLYNRTALAVGSCVAAMYANQLSGQGLQNGGVGGYILNKRKDGTGMAGTWEQRGQSYDYGSGAVEGNESSAVLWQRTS